MLHHDVCHLAGLCIPACEQYTGSTVGAPVLAAARTLNPAIARLAHILFRWQLATVVRRSHFKTLITRHVPQVGPLDAQLFGQLAGKWQAEADDAAGVTLDALDECATETVECE